MAFGDFFGVTKKLNFIDEAERLSRRAPKLLERTGRSVINEGANLLSYSMSGEKFLNRPSKLIAPSVGMSILGPQAGLVGGLAISKLLALTEKKAKLGTRGRQQIEKSPILGRELGAAADTLLSPLSLATLGSGSAFSGSSNLGLRALAPVISRGNFAQRVGGEAAVGLGAQLGVSGVNKALPEDTPGGLRFGAQMLGGLAGGGLGIKATNKIMFSKPRGLPQPEPGAIPKSRSMRGYKRVEIPPGVMAKALGRQPKEYQRITQQFLRYKGGDLTPEEIGIFQDELAKLKSEYITKFGGPPTEGWRQRKSMKGPTKVISAPHENEDMLAANFEREMDRRITMRDVEPPGDAMGMVQRGRQIGDEDKYKFIPESIDEVDLDPVGFPSSHGGNYIEPNKKPLISQRLFAHGTQGDFELPDVEASRNIIQTAKSQGHGLYMAADPNRIAWAGDKVFISAIDDNARVITMEDPADLDLWFKVMRDLGVAPGDVEKQLGPNFTSLQGGPANNFILRDTIVDELLNKKVSDAGWPDIDSYSRDFGVDEESLKTELNKKLAKYIDAFFYNSSHEMETIVVLNDNVVKVLGKIDASRISHESLAGKTWRDIVGMGRDPDVKAGITFIPTNEGTINIRTPDRRLLGTIKPFTPGKYTLDGSFTNRSMGIFDSIEEAKQQARAYWGESGPAIKSFGKQKPPTSSGPMMGIVDESRPANLTTGTQPTLPGINPPPLKPSRPTAKGVLETGNDIMRALWTPIDASPFGIQGLILAFTHPVDWARAVKVSLGEFAKPGKWVDGEWKPGYYENWVKNQDQAIIDKIQQTGKFYPTSADWKTSGTILNPHGTLIGTERMNPVEQALEHTRKIPVIGMGPVSLRSGVEASNRLFTSFGNAARLLIDNTTYNQMETPGFRSWLASGIIDAKGDARKYMPQISAASNRATGTTNNQVLGKIGDALFFAPRFITANIELVLKAGQAGTVDSAIARRQLLQWIGTGVFLTHAANLSRGYDTELDPRKPNFMRIRDVGGTDISAFGYLDTLARGAALTMGGVAGTVGVGEGDPKDAMYLLRSKASPLVSFGIDIVAGQNFAGEDPLALESLGRNLLPFAIRDVDREPITASITGAVGLKSTPLSSTERLTKTLEREGIVESDPDYEIKRREYLLAHPNAQPEVRGKFKEAREVTTNIRAKREANEEDTVSNTQTLAEFRERRSSLLDEQRARLDQIKAKYTKRSSQGSKWIDSYYQLFKDATDTRTGLLDPKKMDQLQANWLSTNGEVAYDYVQRYIQVGQGPVEKQYLQDIQKLQKLGYFDMKKYRGLTSGIDEDRLEDLKDLVSAERKVNPILGRMDFSLAAYRVLKDQPRSVILDVIKLGKKQYTNLAYTRFKTQHLDLLQWFNPNASWGTYQKATKLVERKSA